MKVLIASLWSVSEASIGGTEKFVVDLANSLSHSCSVTVLSLGQIDLNIKGVRTVGLNMIGRFNEDALSVYLDRGGLTEIEFKLNAFLARNKFDIVHCNSLLFANLIKNVPVIQTVHTDREEFYNSFSARIATVIMENIKKDKNAIYVTPSMHGKRSFKSLTRKTALVVAHSFRSDIVLRNRAYVRKNYDISNKDIVFCVPSRLEIRQKGQETLLEALRIIKKKLPSFSVVLGGCDKQYLHNKKYLRKQYPDLKMLITGFSDKSDMYSLADVVVLPSRMESFGYAALESAMMGFPLFLSDIPPYREIAEGNSRIILFKNNPVKLAQVLLRKYKMILVHEAIPPSKKWKKKYSEERMRKNYRSLYKKSILNFWNRK